MKKKKEDIKEFIPAEAKEVYRLSNDWDKLMRIMPHLNTSVTIYRGHHSIHCYSGKHPNVKRVNDATFYNEGFRGTTCDVSHWSEAWFYIEERHGKNIPCIEIADDFGRGLFKLCYNSPSALKVDENIIEEIIKERGDAWDIVHLRRSNILDCHACCELKSKPPFIKQILAIQEEAKMHNIELGLITTHSSHSCWSNLHAMEYNPSNCWLGFSKKHDFVYLQPSGLYKAEVIENSSRAVVIFFNKTGEKVFSIIEPEGTKFHSIRKLKQFLNKNDSNK